jgi:thiol:disulfide interchange protein/DsbC/DsbD-like thiol-disulfide interchange protein
MPRHLFATLRDTFLFGIVLLWLGAAAHAQIGDLLGKPTYKSDQVTAQLLVHAPQGVVAGQTLWAGLQLQHAAKWHTYWLNSGDSGLPTQLTWQLPPGITAGDIAWPTPKKFPLGTLANYGYDGEVLLTVPLTVSPQWQGKHLAIGLTASWLACRTECIPEEASLQTTVAAHMPTSLHGQLFETATDRIPKNIAKNSNISSVEGQFLLINADNLPPSWQGKLLEAFPHTQGIIEPGAAWTQAWQNQTWSARLPLSALRTDAPREMTWVLANNQNLRPGEAAQAGAQLTLPVDGTWPSANAIPATIPPALEAALAAGSRNAQDAATPIQQVVNTPAPTLSGWLFAVAGAFIGGLLLNLMPCVFPVLAIKVLAFTQHNDTGLHAATVKAQHRASGLAYTAGVVLSFMALGGLLLGLRAAGEQLGWGFQLQSPGVVVTLATLFTLIGLNLMGVFEIGNLLPSSVATMQATHPTVDAFLTGVLATAVASPCTAPFMGASLGLAIGLPVAQALAVFAAIGVGMSLPYLLASWWPAVARALPRPGAWMNTFKQLMAFPMFATVIWLVWVLGHQTGVNGASALLAILVAWAMLAWSWGLRQGGATGLRGLSAATLLALLAGIGPLTWTLQEESSAPTAQSATGSGQATDTTASWAPWTATRADEITQSGRMVLVDFTAAWCVTCQYNKRTTLSDSALLADLAARNVATLRADWTRRDPAITAALAVLGRNGVPTYAVYRPGKAPIVLTEILSVADVRAALSAP